MHIAIVGAGAMAAIHLARAGAAVSLFDHSHPREKPCGGGLTGRAVALVSEVIDLASLPAIAIDSALVESAGKLWWRSVVQSGRKFEVAERRGALRPREQNE